jgi:mono/diheme cytochrome c family protein
MLYKVISLLYISCFKKYKTKVMQNIPHSIKIFLSLFLVVIIGSCEKDYYQEPPAPATSDATATLEAVHVNAAPSAITSAYWKTADYLKINSANLSINHLYADGLLNLTGSYGGLSSYNNGADPGLVLKAAYDNDNLYILAEWTDLDVDVSNSSWLYNGPIDLHKSDATPGWTSQRNCDRLAFAFEIANASGSSGTFSSVGCAASCHNTGITPYMHPDAGKVDIWNWSLALSAPLGYVTDMVANSDSLSCDAGQKMFLRNSIGSTSRSGPAYEWDGATQAITLPNGQSSILDPAFYLLNKTPFIGDASRGDSIYHRPAPPGDCVSCHGDHGEGASEGAINTISQNKKSRTALMTSMDNTADMAAYWGGLSGSDRDDIIAYLRGLSGVPGYYLNAPDGSNADIKAISNVTPVNIKNAMLPATNQHTKYQVLITRKLQTNNPDDAQFDLTSVKTFKFGIALMDNDGKNHIGSNVETLTFK